jgi:hypothetical protein
MALGFIAGASFSWKIMVKTGGRLVLLVGAATDTLDFLWLSMIQVGSSYWASVLAPAFRCAFAKVQLFSPLANTATAGVNCADAGLASGYSTPHAK